MGYLVTGIVLLSGTIRLWWISLPTKRGQMQPFLEHGIDTWVAVGLGDDSP
jgi:hypothetical protein